jgi:hypothetical protein
MEGVVSDLWLRLRRLEGCCDVKVESIKPEIEADRVWRVTARHRDDADESPIVAAGRNATEALLRALDEADARGWRAQ